MHVLPASRSSSSSRVRYRGPKGKPRGKPAGTFGLLSFLGSPKLPLPLPSPRLWWISQLDPGAVLSSSSSMELLLWSGSRSEPWRGRQGDPRLLPVLTAGAARQGSESRALPRIESGKASRAIRGAPQKAHFKAWGGN